MIQITLNFTSIEAARAALLEIPLSVLAGAPAIKAEPKAEKPAKVEKPAAPAPVVEAPATVVEAPAASAVDYPTLQKAVFALAGRSREAAASVAAALGVKTFKELTEDKWAEALVAVNAALAEAA